MLSNNLLSLLQYIYFCLDSQVFHCTLQQKKYKTIMRTVQIKFIVIQV